MTEKVTGPAPNDWRRQGQEKYLARARLIAQKYHPYRNDWEHDHCEFCGDKLSISEGDLTYGYSTEDNYYWVCFRCFDDFKEEFQWVVDDTSQIQP